MDINTKQVAGHTGWLAVYPQNTMLAFSEAILAGVDIIETDVRLTRDGVWILVHEYDLSNATTNGTGLVHETDWSYIQTLEVKFWDGRYAGREDIKVPSLQQLIDLVKGTNVKIMLDLKQWQYNPYQNTSLRVNEMTDLVNFVNTNGVLDQCIFHSNEPVCNDLKDNFSQLVTAPFYYGAEYFNSEYSSALQNAINKGHEIVYWNDGVYDEYPNTYVTETMVKAFQNQGILFGVTTISNSSPGGYYKTKLYDMLGVNHFMVDHVSASINALTDGIDIGIVLPTSPSLGVITCEVVINLNGDLKKVELVTNNNGQLVKQKTTFGLL